MKTFSIVLIRIFSLFLIVTAIYTFGPVFFYPSSDLFQLPEFKLSLIVSVVLPAIGRVLLWVLAPKISNLMHVHEGNETSINEVGIVRSGTFLLGIYYIIRTSGVFVTSLVINHRIDINSTVLLVLAVILVIGNGLFVKLYKKLKHFGENT